MFDFIQFIRNKWGEYTSSPSQRGTVIDELAVKPTGLAMSDFYNSLVDINISSNIENADDMTDGQMDTFGNKFYMDRESGNYAFGKVRIYFDEKKTITIDEDFRAVSTTGLKYKASDLRVVSRNSFKESGERASKYYIDVNIKATSPGTEYNIDASEITSIDGVEFAYKRVTNLEDIYNGARYETNSQYADRLKYSVNDRSMMNQRSTFARLKEFFPYVNSIFVAGSGNKYMTRDLVQAVDLSIPQKKADFLGKITGNNLINNSAYYGIFPPEAGTRPAAFAGPFSIYSDYNYPLTVESVNLSSSDPALHGYPLDQENTAEMYQGLYFDDYKNFMEVETTDLFNIADEAVGLSDKISPNTDWIIGANGRYNGDYGVLQQGLSKINIVRFNNNLIELSAGSGGSVSVIKDTNKRVGVRMTGIFKAPDAADNSEASLGSGLQFMVGGANGGSLVDAYTGIGWGFRLNSAPDANPSIHNAVIYFAHSEKYGSGQVFAATDDFVGTGGHVSVANINALAETTTRLTPNSEYRFEFTLYDNLSLSLYISKVSPVGVADPDDIFESWFLPETILNVFSQEILKIDSTHYGTDMKVTLDTDSVDNTDKWEVTDLRLVDIAQKRSNALFIFDTKDIEPPFTIEYRGNGTSSIDGSASSGYSVYIWDTEREAPSGADSVLTLGGWTELDGVSNPKGLKDEISENLTHNLTNIDRYVVKSRYGDSLILLATTTGMSEMKIRAKGDSTEDVISYIRADYVKVRSQEVDTYHANNKADVYVNTMLSTETPETVETTITKNTSEPYFVLNEENGFTMPIAEIVSVTVVGAGGEEELADTDYTIIRNDTDHLNSKYEDIVLTLENGTYNEITVEYTVYRSVRDIQDFYDSSEYQKTHGEVLVKHKFPCYMDISLFYSGNVEKEEVTTAIQTYVDENVDGEFSVRDMISYLYNEGVVNNVQEPVEIQYEKMNDDYNTETGSFTDMLSIRNVDFFRTRDITVDRL